MMYDEDFRPSVPPPKRVVADSPTSPMGTAKESPRQKGVQSASGVDNLAKTGADEGTAHAVASEATVDFMTESRPGGCDIVPPRPPPQTVDAAKVEIIPITKHEPEFATAEDSERSDSQKTVLTTLGVLPILGWLLIVVVAAWMFSVSSPFLANALMLHGWRFWCSLVMGTAPAIAVAGILAYALWQFCKVPKLEQFRPSAFSSSQELRHALTTRYLAQFPDAIDYACKNGFEDGEKKKNKTLFVGCLRRLRGESPGRYADSLGWMADFRHFQNLQDARANEIVVETAKSVGLKTAASPWKIADMLAVAYHSTIMVVELSRLYNRRISPRAAFRLSCRWFFDIYVSGQAGDATQAAAEWSATAVSAIWKPVASLIGRVAEGGANAFLVYRLGRRAVSDFRPLVDGRVGE